jgi:hypothetical protein
MTQTEINFLISRVNDLTETVSTQFEGTRAVLSEKTKEELVNTVLALATVIMIDRKSRGDH